MRAWGAGRAKRYAGCEGREFEVEGNACQHFPPLLPSLIFSAASVAPQAFACSSRAEREGLLRRLQIWEIGTFLFCLFTSHYSKSTYITAWESFNESSILPKYLVAPLSPGLLTHLWFPAPSRWLHQELWNLQPQDETRNVRIKAIWEGNFKPFLPLATVKQNRS